MWVSECGKVNGLLSASLNKSVLSLIIMKLFYIRFKYFQVIMSRLFLDFAWTLAEPDINLSGFFSFHFILGIITSCRFA